MSAAALETTSPLVHSDQKWTEDAICAQIDPDLFFPEKGASIQQAKRVCDSCPVRQQCLDAALRNNERFGIWGGLSERERREYRRDDSTSPQGLEIDDPTDERDRIDQTLASL